jgi:hypothetical protein
MTSSAIKGTAFESATADVLRLIHENAITREEVEARLEVGDLEMLDSKIMAASWYPMDTYARLITILRDVEGGGDVAYLVERGRSGAKRISATGIYSQLNGIPEKREIYGERFGRFIATLGQAIFREVTFTHKRIDEESGPPGYFLRLSVPRDFPDICRHPVQGFAAYLTEISLDEPYLVTSERTAPDLITIWGRPVNR